MVKRIGRHLGLDSHEVRRVWLRSGADYRAAAKELGVTDTTVRYHVRAVNQSHPLTYQQGSHEDREAMVEYVRAMLRRAEVTPPAPRSTE